MDDYSTITRTTQLHVGTMLNVPITFRQSRACMMLSRSTRDSWIAQALNGSWAWHTVERRLLAGCFLKEVVAMMLCF